MMNVFTTGLLVLSITMVFASTQEEAHLNYTLTSHNEDIKESIDVNYKRKYVIISTPAHKDAQEVAMFHDYSVGLNLLKQNGKCFVLHGFDGVPENIKDWEKVETNFVDEHVGEVTLFRGYVLRQVSATLNRTTLPETVQEFCSGSIGLVVVEDVVTGDEALNKPRGPMGDDAGFSEIFVPGQVTRGGKRVKRWGWGAAWTWISIGISIITAVFG